MRSARRSLFRRSPRAVVLYAGLVLGLAALVGPTAPAHGQIYVWWGGEVIPGTEGITPGPGMSAAFMSLYYALTSQSLFILPAERTDVVVDLSSCPPGSHLILYNDAPAPGPLFDTRNDYYTGSPDQTSVGGAPPTTHGFGPKTRTVLRIDIDPNGVPTAPFNLGALQATMPKAYKASQAPPIVPPAAYKAAFGTSNANTYVQNIDQSLNLTGTVQPVALVMTTLPGAGYTTAPTVKFAGGGGAGATATAALNGVSAVAAALSTSPPSITLNWVNHAANALGTTIQRATNTAFTTGLVSTTVNTRTSRPAR
jgi:hypothetical protein